MLEIQSREVNHAAISEGIPFYQIENEILRSRDSELIAGYFLLLKQGRTTRNFYHEGKTYVLSRGEVLTGRGILGKALGASENTGKRVLDRLRNIGAITLQTRLFRASIYSVENWESKKIFARRVPDVFPDAEIPEPCAISELAMGKETDIFPMKVRQQEFIICDNKEQQHAESKIRLHESGSHNATALEITGSDPNPGESKSFTLEPTHRFRLSEEAFSRYDEMGVFAQYGHSYLDYLWEWMKSKPGIRNKEGWVVQALKKAWMIEEFEKALYPPTVQADQDPGPVSTGNGQTSSPGDEFEPGIDKAEMIAIIRNKELQIRDIMKRDRRYKKYSTRPIDDPVFQLSARAIFNESF